MNQTTYKLLLCFRLAATPALVMPALVTPALITPASATPPDIAPDSQPWVPGEPFPLPRLRDPNERPHDSPPIQPAMALRQPAAPALTPAPAPTPAPARTDPQAAGPDVLLAPAPPATDLSHTDIAAAAASLQASMQADVRNLLPAARATDMLQLASHPIEAPQLVVVVDRNPAVETLSLMLARPGGAQHWQLIGAAHVSTGQANRKDYYITPLGVFAHTDAILDFRALGTYNEHHVRGLGTAGMRVWDFGWQWAMKGWHTDNAGGDIRLQMHATDPTLLEQRLGRPASEGCVRVSSTMNRFMDRFGILDADYEHAAAQNPRYAALLAPDRTPTPLAGRLLVVIDTSLPADTPPTQQSRPAGWPDPTLAPPPAEPGGSLDSAPPQVR